MQEAELKDLPYCVSQCLSTEAVRIDRAYELRGAGVTALGKNKFDVKVLAIGALVWQSLKKKHAGNRGNDIKVSITEAILVSRLTLRRYLDDK